MSRASILLNSALLFFLLLCPTLHLHAQSDLEKAAKALQIFSDTLNKLQKPNQISPENPYNNQSTQPRNQASAPDGSSAELLWGTALIPKSDDLFSSMVFSLRRLNTSSPYYRILNPWKPGDMAGDASSLLAVYIMPKIDLEEITVTVSADPFLKPSRYILRDIKARSSRVIKPTLNWNFSSLRNLPQSCPATLVTEITGPNGMSIGQSQKQITVRTANECPMSLTPAISPFDYLLAGYVNEDSPFIDRLLQEALGSSITDKFCGYQGSKDVVYKQIFAVWHVLQRRGMRYSSIPTTGVSSSGNFGVQYIRFMDESLLRQQANCLDGSILFASICQKVSLQSAIVLLRGHAIVGIRESNGDGPWILLDTTEMKDVQFAGFGAATASWSNFNQALGQGVTSFQNSERNGYKAKFIEIQKAREMGVIPIPLISSQH